MTDPIDTRPLSVRMREASGYGMSNRWVAEVEALEAQVETDGAVILQLGRMNDALTDDNGTLTEINDSMADERDALLHTIESLKDRVEELTDQLDTAAGLLGIA